MSRLAFQFTNWFFTMGDARTAAALRIGYGVLLIFMLWDLYPALDLLLSSSGLYPSPQIEHLTPYHPFGLLYFANSPFLLRIWFWITLILAVMTILGIGTRVSMILLFYSVLLLHTRIPQMLYGADKVFAMCYFWLLFSASDRCWSLDQYFRSLKHKNKSTEIQLWPVKTIQIQVALIYLMTGLAKLTDDFWINGSAVYYALHFYPFVWEGAQKVLSLTPLLVFMTYYTLLAELSFPFLVFRKKTKWFAIGAVFFMHLGIEIFMHIRFFALSMFVSYIAFMQAKEWDWLSRHVTGKIQFTKDKLVSK